MQPLNIPDFLKLACEQERCFVYDGEMFKDCITFVFRNPLLSGRKSYLKFVISDREEVQEKYKDCGFFQLCYFMLGLREWKNRKGNTMTLIGYNNRDFDDPVLQVILDRFKQKKLITASEVYKMTQDYIESNVKIKVDKYDFNGLDVMKMSNYGAFQQNTTSLKHLEFSMRKDSVDDLPFEHYESVTKSKITKLLSYNVKDVDATTDFFYSCADKLQSRFQFMLETDKKDISLISLSDSQIGQRIFKDYFQKNVPSYNKDMDKGTERKIIKVDECIFDYVEFSSPEFRNLLKFMREKEIKAERVKNRRGKWTNKMSLKDVFTYTATHKGVEYNYGTGGLHACRGTGLYLENEEYTIFSCDVSSFYPNLSIVNRYFPEHLSVAFCDVYKELYDLRKSIPKSNPRNKDIKDSLNSLYGLSAVQYPGLIRDMKYTITTTINGQLLLTMLCEKLAEIGDIIFANTDGVEVYLPKNKVESAKQIMQEWMDTTGLVLEDELYSMIVAKDVNNYISVNHAGKVKRKGSFETYEDIANSKTWHKNPSKSIIPLALNEYFINGTPVDDVILEHDNIHDFLISRKGHKNAHYLIFTPDETGAISSPQKQKERVVRYYIANRGGSLFKMTTGGKSAGTLSCVQSGLMIEMAMKIKEVDAREHENLNYDWYIKECDDLIEDIEYSRYSLPLDPNVKKFHEINDYLNSFPGRTVKKEHLQATKEKFELTDDQVKTLLKGVREWVGMEAKTLNN